MPNNTRFARGVGTSRPNRASWHIFDALPRPLRAALWEAPVSVNPLSALELLEDGGTAYAIEALHEACASELTMFAAEYRRATGTPLPHLAAGARLQRYSPQPGRPSSQAAKRAARATRRRPTPPWAEVAETVR